MCRLRCAVLCCAAQVTQKKAAAIQQLPELLACVGGADAASSVDPGEVARPPACLPCLPACLFALPA